LKDFYEQKKESSPHKGFFLLFFYPNGVLRSIKRGLWRLCGLVWSPKKRGF